MCYSYKNLCLKKTISFDMTVLQRAQRLPKAGLSGMNLFGAEAFFMCVFESLSSWEDSHGEIEGMRHSSRKYLVAIQSVGKLCCLGKVFCRVGAMMMP